ncbi:MAG: PrgI family protein [Patescibacteria group bacterium]
MQFQVPQFIDFSPKIVGPLSIKQFLYLAGAAVPTFIFYFMFNFWLWIIVSAILWVIALPLAFAKYNGQPIPRIMGAALLYFWKPRFYLWKREEAHLNLPSMPRLPRESFIETQKKTLKDLILKITTTTHPIEKREKPLQFLQAFGTTKDNFERVRKNTGERRVAKRVDYR